MALLAASIPATLVFQSVATAWIAILLPPKDSLKPVVLYLGLGALGFPVFPVLRGGVACFFGPDAGFLLAPLLQTPLTSWWLRRDPGLSWRQLIPGLALGYGVFLGFGVAWAQAWGGLSPKMAKALGILVLPRIAFKIWLVGTLARGVASSRPDILPREFREQAPVHAAGDPVAEPARGEGPEQGPEPGVGPIGAP